MMLAKFWGTIDGVPYYGWNIYFINPYFTDYRDWFQGKGAYITSDVADIIPEIPQISKVNSAFLPKEGDPIYVSPNCPYALDDLRKHYKIKRNPDDGVCNVVSPIEKGKSFYCTDILKCPDEKLLVVGQDSVMVRSAGTRILLYAPKNAVYIRKSFRLYRYKGTTFPEVYQKILNGTLTKPIVSPEQLNVRNSNAVTLDTLSLLITTGGARSAKETDEAFVLQLQALNQCDWQSYKGCLTNIFRYMRNFSGFSCFNRYYKAPSGLPKAVKMLWDECVINGYQKTMQTPEEYDLFMTWYKDLAHIGSDKFMTTVPTIIEKTHGTRYFFDTLFNTQVLVKQKSFQEYRASCQ